jgi:hypothetical protein
MGLFDQILGAVANPNQQGSMGQLGTILNTVQQLSNTTGADPAAMQSVLSVVGGQVRSALQQKRETQGPEAVENFVNEYAGTSPNPQAVNSLFSPRVQQQVAQAASRYTGLDTSMILQVLPLLVPIVLNFLKSGANNQGSGNPVLNSFLDSDRDGDVDIADVMRMVGQYMG